MDGRRPRVAGASFCESTASLRESGLEPETGFSLVKDIAGLLPRAENGVSFPQTQSRVHVPWYQKGSLHGTRFSEVVQLVRRRAGRRG